MKKLIITASLYTAVTALLLGVIYPLAVTAISQLAMPHMANGQLIGQGDQLSGSRLIGQPFTGPEYFHSRPSAAGLGYDASSSGASNLAQTSKTLRDREIASIAAENSGSPIPIDLVTASASGIDPDITPAAAFYQIQRIAQARQLPEQTLRQLVSDAITPRQFGLLGEPRVNVLQLNLQLDHLNK